MLVGKRMTKEPVTTTSDEYLATVMAAMEKGGFRHMPVVKQGKLAGIVTDRDARQHIGFLEKTKVNAAMTENAVTVAPQTTLEEAAQLLLKRKIGGMPVMQEGKLVGIITTSDILKAFLEVMGVEEEGTARIDIVLKGDEQDLTTASETISIEGGEILSVGTYREKWGDDPVCYLRVREGDPEKIAEALKKRGYTILGVHV